MIDLGTLGGATSIAYAVNARGQVVGNSFTPRYTVDHAFSWTPEGGMIDLGSLGGPSFAVALSSRGHIVGYSTPAGNFTDHALSWTPEGGMIDLGGRDSSTFAAAVNTLGQVVGYSTGSAADHAFAWTPAGGMIDLGTLGGNFSYAYAVNARGDIVGDSTTVAGDHPSPVHAVLWRASATPRRGARADDEVEAGPRVEREAREGDEGGHCHRRGEGRDAEREDD